MLFRSQLDAVFVGIAQVEGFAHAVIAGAIERNARAQHAMQRIGECRPRRIEDGSVEEAGGARRRWMATLALPGIESDVVVVAAGRDECGARAHALHQLEAEHIAIEAERAVEVGDLEVDMSDAGTGDDGWVRGHQDPPRGEKEGPFAQISADRTLDGGRHLLDGAERLNSHHITKSAIVCA